MLIHCFDSGELFQFVIICERKAKQTKLQQSVSIKAVFDQ